MCNNGLKSRIKFAPVLYLSIFALQVWAGEPPQEGIPGFVRLVRHENQCIHVLTTITGSRTTADGLMEFGVQMTLLPGCGSGDSSLRTGVWPEFSKHLTFEFALTDSKQGEQSHQTLAAQLLSEYQPAWREGFSMKTLEFQLKAESTSVPPAGFLLVTVLVDTKPLDTFKLPLPADKTEKKKKPKSTKQKSAKTS